MIDLIQSCTLYVLNFYLVNEKCPLDGIILFASLKDEDFNVKYLKKFYLFNDTQIERCPRLIHSKAYATHNDLCKIIRMSQVWNQVLVPFFYGKLMNINILL